MPHFRSLIKFELIIYDKPIFCINIKRFITIHNFKCINGLACQYIHILYICIGTRRGYSLSTNYNSSYKWLQSGLNFSQSKLYHLQPRSAEDWQKNGLEEIDLFCQQLHGPVALPYASYQEIGLGCRLAPRSSAAEDPWQPEEVLRPDESHCAVPEERVCFPGSFDPVVMFRLNLIIIYLIFKLTTYFNINYFFI